jgi:D-arabinose 1-dehydrogenase-like Zn-dependent alcohol dehydrogenase
MATQQKFEGWVAEKSTKEQDLVWKEYEMKAFEDTDIEIRITHCGVCGTDDHVSKNGWVSFKTSIISQQANSTGFDFLPDCRRA